jgi:hypothetical protein
MHDKSIKTANSLYMSGMYKEALVLYEQLSHRLGWSDILHANIALCKKKINNSKKLNKSNDNIVDFCSPKIIVSMTTIFDRLQYLPKVISTLLSQSLRPYRIDLNISHGSYLLDKGISADNPIILDLQLNKNINVNWVDNIGSYRKIWPLMEEYFSSEIEQDSIFVTVDDDTLYPEYFLETLYEQYKIHNCIIAFRGRHIEIQDRQIAPYNCWSLGKTVPSLCNLPTGKDGVLYSTKYFTKDFLNLDIAQRLANTADDMWIKWHCALNGVPALILNPIACTSDYKSFPVVCYDSEYRGNSLYTIHNKTTAYNKNDDAVQELEKYYKSVYGYDMAWLIQMESKAML